MTKELKVACIPISVFYSDKKDDKIIRFCFAKEESELKEALRRLMHVKSVFY
jgi:methionine aminotransferase